MAYQYNVIVPITHPHLKGDPRFGHHSVYTVDVDIADDELLDKRGPIITDEGGMVEVARREAEERGRERYTWVIFDGLHDMGGKMPQAIYLGDTPLPASLVAASDS